MGGGASLAREGIIRDGRPPEIGEPLHPGRGIPNHALDFLQAPLPRPPAFSHSGTYRPSSDASHHEQRDPERTVSLHWGTSLSLR
jgi:hypothetical protein